MAKVDKGLATALRKARARLGETQAQFAARMGVNQATISRWEVDGPRTGPSKAAARHILSSVEHIFGSPAR
jgi:transcriptional regulator with XRE-family HTH domain